MSGVLPEAIFLIAAEVMTHCWRKWTTEFNNMNENPFKRVKMTNHWKMPTHYFFKAHSLRFNVLQRVR